MDDSGAVTILDPLGGRIVMLSPGRRVKTAIQTADLSASINNLQQNITNNDLSKMLSAAKQVTFDEQNQTAASGR